MSRTNQKEGNVEIGRPAYVLAARGRPGGRTRSQAMGMGRQEKAPRGLKRNRIPRERD